MKNYTITAILILVVIISCKKDVTATKPVKEYLKAHKWSNVSTTINPANDWYQTGEKITDLIAPLGACALDDLLVFDTDSTLYTETGANKCEVDEKDKVHIGKYSVSADEKLLYRDELTVPSNITEISDSRLILETTFKGSDDVTYKITEVLEAK